MQHIWRKRGAFLLRYDRPIYRHLFPRLGLFVALVCILTSCGHSLKVQIDYLTHKDLASYYVNTPDPRQNVSAVGQRLIIGWIVPKAYLSYDDLHLEITIRFRNKEEVVEIFHLLKTRGTYVFSLFNEDYFSKRGILTYKINLIGNGTILDSWRHQIWFDLIQVNASEQSSPPSGTTQKEEQQCVPESEDYPIEWNDSEF